MSDIIEKQKEISREISTYISAIYPTIEKKSERAFCVSTASLLSEVFGEKLNLNDNSYELHCTMFYLIYGLSTNEIAKKMNTTYSSILNNLTTIYETLDVENKHDFLSRMLLWLLQRKKILLFPSEEVTCKPLTKDEVLEEVI